MPLKLEELIDHLDNIRAGRASFDMQQSIKEDPSTMQEWRYLHLAVEGIQDAALVERIMQARLNWAAQQMMTDASSRPLSIASYAFFRKAIRMTACVLLIIAGSALYKYLTTSSSELYYEYYVPYQLDGAGIPEGGSNAQTARPSVRSMIETKNIEQAYQQRDWLAVTSDFDHTVNKSNELYFLAGVASLESKKYPDAIDKFHQVMTNNARTGSESFQDDAEYYLAMSWLASGEIKEALPLLKKISSDKDHLYHDRVARISPLSLRIAIYKEYK